MKNPNTQKYSEVFDCIVIGGGVVGCFCARYLSMFEGRFLLAEKGNDVSVGASKANSGIVHAGYDAKSGTAKAKFNVAGAAVMESVCRELDVPYKKNGALVVELEKSDALEKLKERGDANGVRTEIISGDAAREKESRLSKNITRALYAPSSGLVSPYELAIACYENFIHNGGEAAFNCAVKNIVKGDLYSVTAEVNGKSVVYKAKTVINAAGLYSDVLHNLVCDDKLYIKPRRGQYMLLDKSAFVTDHTVFQTPTAMGKGVLVAPTCHGNTLLGPSAEDITDPSDVATSAGGLDDVFARAALSVPDLSRRDIITQFAGNRAVCGDDFIIGENEDGFFDAVGICSPGLASSPAIGRYLAEAVANKLGLAENKEFDPAREGIPKFSELSDGERDALIKKNPAFGRIVCRCETITEGEIAEAIKRGATDLDGIKRRVRAGMGRCQAGFCTPNLIKILSRELNVPTLYATKCGGQSYILKK